MLLICANRSFKIFLALGTIAVVGVVGGSYIGGGHSVDGMSIE